MEYKNIANLLGNTSDQPSKFRTRNWIEINVESRGIYPANKKINFKTSMLRCSLCDYSDAHILARGNISVNNTAAADAGANDNNIIVLHLRTA